MRLAGRERLGSTLFRFQRRSESADSYDFGECSALDPSIGEGGAFRNHRRSKGDPVRNELDAQRAASRRSSAGCGDSRGLFFDVQCPVESFSF